MKAALFALLLGLQCADVATTLYAIKRGAHEDGRTFMSRVFGFFEEDWPFALVGVKLAFVGLIWWQYHAIAWWALLLLAVLYVAVLRNNIRVIRRLGG